MHLKQFSVTLTVFVYPSLGLEGGPEGLTFVEPPIFALVRTGNLSSYIESVVPGCWQREFCVLRPTFSFKTDSTPPKTPRDQARSLMVEMSLRNLSGSICKGLHEILHTGGDANNFRFECYGDHNEHIRTAFLMPAVELRSIKNNLIDGGIVPIEKKMLQDMHADRTKDREVESPPFGKGILVNLPAAAIDHVGESVQFTAPFQSKEDHLFILESAVAFAKKLGIERQQDWEEASKQKYA